MRILTRAYVENSRKSVTKVTAKIILPATGIDIRSVNFQINKTNRQLTQRIDMLCASSICSSLVLLVPQNISFHLLLFTCTHSHTHKMYRSLQFGHWPNQYVKPKNYSQNSLICCRHKIVIILTLAVRCCALFLFPQPPLFTSLPLPLPHSSSSSPFHCCCSIFFGTYF